MSALLTTHDLQTKKAPAKRWRSMWRVLRPCTLQAKNGDHECERGEVITLGVFPSREIAEQNAQDVQDVQAAPPRVLALMKIYPETNTN